MSRLTNRFPRRADLALLTGLALLALPFSGRIEAAGPVDALERALREAETALQEGEPQVAESRYRSALLEGWYLLGSLSIEEDALIDAKDAFERANSFDVEKVRDAIAATDMKTFYGDIRFSEAGNNIAKPMVLRQIQDGTFNVVAPSKWASHSVNHPRKAQ